jgi:Major intrinsic protein
VAVVPVSDRCLYGGVVENSGPALVSGELHSLWIYIVAPLLGAALGAVTYQFVRGEPSPALEVRREIAG